MCVCVWGGVLSGSGYSSLLPEGHSKHLFYCDLNISSQTPREDKWLSLIRINLPVKIAIILLPHKLVIHIMAAVECGGVSDSWFCWTIKAREANCFTRQNLCIKVCSCTIVCRERVKCLTVTSKTSLFLLKTLMRIAAVIKKKKMSHGSVQIGGNSDSFSDAKSFLKSTELNFFFFFKLHNEEPGIKGTWNGDSRFSPIKDQFMPQTTNKTFKPAHFTLLNSAFWCKSASLRQDITLPCHSNCYNPIYLIVHWSSYSSSQEPWFYD